MAAETVIERRDQRIDLEAVAIIAGLGLRLDVVGEGAGFVNLAVKPNCLTLTYRVDAGPARGIMATVSLTRDGAAAVARAILSSLGLEG